MRFVGSAAGSWWINDWMAITIFNVFVQVNGFVFRLFRPSHIHHNQLFITPLHGLHVCLRPDTLHERMRSRRWRRERERGARQLKLTETCRASEVCVPQIFFFLLLSLLVRCHFSAESHCRLQFPEFCIFRVCSFFPSFCQQASYFDSFSSLCVRSFHSFM